jgi:hypothetical protein
MDLSTQFSNTISKTSTLCNIKNLSKDDSKFAYPKLQCAKESSLLHFNYCNLAIYMVNFFKVFSTHHFCGVGQHPMVEFQKDKKIQFMQFALEVMVLECTFLKHSQGILRIEHF